MSVHENFTIIDWSIVLCYLLLTTWVGHAMRGKQGTIKDFFLGGEIITMACSKRINYCN